MSPNKVFLALSCALPLLAQACGTVRVAYSDQERPPYYFGSGRTVPPRPGASPDLMRELLEAAGCKVEFLRFPMARLRVVLKEGLVDAAPLVAKGDDFENYAFPGDASGKADPARALGTMVVFIVRRGDQIPADTDPASYFKSRRMGAVHGAPFIGPMRGKGYTIDDGALDMARNLDKLRRHRIDAFALGVTSLEEADVSVATGPSSEFQRLRGVMEESHVWMAFNKAWAASHPQIAESVWNQVGERGRARFSDLVRQYQKR